LSFGFSKPYLVENLGRVRYGKSIERSMWSKSKDHRTW
jgi:hypothetical protein